MYISYHNQYHDVSHCLYVRPTFYKERDEYLI